MPIYDFECASCGNRFEELVSAGTGTATCPACNTDGAERRFSGFAVTTKQLTGNQQRRLEDKRGTDRGGARERFQKSLDTGRAKRGRPPGGVGS